jgi:hypothetical protein
MKPLDARAEFDKDIPTIPMLIGGDWRTSREHYDVKDPSHHHRLSAALFDVRSRRRVDRRDEGQAGCRQHAGL